MKQHNKLDICNAKTNTDLWLLCCVCVRLLSVE